jgi:type 2 lantibiotic biosynthesis protein LanM
LIGPPHLLRGFAVVYKDEHLLWRDLLPPTILSQRLCSLREASIPVPQELKAAVSAADLQIAPPAIGTALSISKEPLREIVERSAFLEERLGGNLLPETRAEDSEVLNERMAAWRKNCAKGDEKVFLKRLQWDGLGQRRARDLVGRVRRASFELPYWARLLGQMIESTGEAWDKALVNNDLGSIRGERPVAFEGLFHPFLRLAREALRKESGQAYSLLAYAAHRQWEKSLLLSLEAIARETLDHEFTDFRSAHQDSSTVALSRSAGSVPGTGGRELYEAFLCSVRGDGLLRLFLKYPVLGRFLATRLSQWVAAAREFLLRLEADQPELAARFNQGHPLGPVVKLDTDLSDRHRAGRTVLRAHFAAGVRLIYKPKMIAAEAAYWDLLSWINRNADLPAFRTLQVLDRGAYGWVEEIEPRPCPHERDVKTFYYRAGMLLCLIYALEGSDCHHENLIATADQPVLIDHETLLQARIRYFGRQGKEGPLSLAGRSFYEDSVFRTGLLPRWEIRPSGESYDVSGLGGSEVQLTHRWRKIWENVNTDAMRLGAEPIFTRLTHNVVILDGEKVQAAHYVDEIAAGFTQMYRFLQARGPELLSPNSPLRNWSGLRFVFRSTAIYALMLKQLYSPRCLGDGVDASIELELFSRPLLYAEHRPSSWPILADERRSLLQGDIPMFQYAAESDSLMLEGGGSIPQFFRESGFSQVQRRFRTLSEEDLERQLGFLCASFELQEGEPKTVGSKAPEPSEVPLEDEAGPDDFLAEALRIAQEIRHAARSFKEGVSWNTLAYYAEAQRCRLEPMGTCFYSGLSGVALFLAGAQKLSAEPNLATLARSALETVVREAVRPEYASALFDLGIGAAAGQSSVMYALVRASEFLGDEEWLHHAQRFAEMLDAERIASDRKLDLISGAAGAALALLALYRVTRLPEALDKAVLCGEHLLQHRWESRQGPRAWKTIKSEEILTGFSHGAAGIAYALLKLYEASGENSFREAALEAQAYETSVFLPEVSNWPDFRQQSGERGYGYMTSWCHGAPGIALSRLAALPILDTPQVRQDIYHGLRATRLAGTQGQDTLCCGAMGRVETLVVAAKELGDPAYLQDARKMASSVLRRAQEEGKYALGWKKAPFLASFHQGMAGIGYEFLRLAAPDSLPSLLIWE